MQSKKYTKEIARKISKNRLQLKQSNRLSNKILAFVIYFL